MEAFAAFNIQICDGEDLMMLYWGFWTLIQVGSVIAIFGIMLNQWYSLRKNIRRGTWLLGRRFWLLLPLDMLGRAVLRQLGGSGWVKRRRRRCGIWME
jgi:hypothetical protein